MRLFLLPFFSIFSIFKNMDIRKKLRKALLEGKHKNHKNKFGCLMVYLEIKKRDWDAILKEIDDEDLYEPEDDPTYGKEKEPHITILFGFHNNISDSEIEKEIDTIKPPKLEFSKVSAFKNKLFDVIKFDVKSDDMHKLNKQFSKFPHSTDFPNYHPHCTIAYVKPELSEKYIKVLNKHTEIPIKISHLVYSKADGTKKTYQL